MKTNFEQERAWWNSKADREEEDSADETINRLLRWREIERHLQNVKTILAVGAATGAFSIPLAKRGFEVMHVDIAANMLDVARQKSAGISNIQFVEANAADLSQFADRSFDLVLNMDGAISFCGSEADTAIAESCRVTGRKLIISVSNRAWMIPLWVAASLEELGHFSQAVYAMFDPGVWFYEQFPENAQLSKNYLGPIKAFLPEELCRSLENCGLKVLRCGGLGTLANLCGQEAVNPVLNDNVLLENFLDLCEGYDRDILPEGPGTKQRAGLFAVAKR